MTNVFIILGVIVYFIIFPNNLDLDMTVIKEILSSNNINVDVENPEILVHIEINKELQNTLEEHFGADLNIYTEQDLYEQSRKIIQTYKDKYINQNYYKYRKYF